MSPAAPPAQSCAMRLRLRLRQIVLGGPKALAVDEVAFLKELWDDLDRDAIDDSVWLQEFMEV
eukprot:6222364-Prymnesium_polylepis.1